MKRDMDVVRKVLFAIEEQHVPGKRIPTIQVEGLSRPELASYLETLQEQGYVADVGILKTETHGAMEAEGGRLTGLGHDFLDAVRDEGVWSQVQGQLRKSGTVVTLEVVKAMAVAYFKSKVGLDP